MEKQNVPDNIVKLDEGMKESGFEAGVRRAFNPIGFSGTEIFGGYFSEEYLQQLRGKRGAKVFDEMRRSEPQVSMLLRGITNPLKSAQWAFVPPKAEDVPEGQLHADFLDEVFKVGMDFETFLHEMFTFLMFGHSVFEVIHSVVLDHPKFGNFNGLKALAWRSPKTIERWKLEPTTGNLLSVEQMVYSDVGKSTCIPGEFLLVFSLDKEGDNYEGISILRPMYGPWFRKNLYQKLAAIGAEKNAIGTPKAKVPPGKEKTEEFKKLKEILEAYTSHECAYITYPEGWDIEIVKGEFDGEKLKELVVLENTEMINAVVANFLALGMNGGGGAFALGSDLSDIFLASIQTYGNFAAGVINRQLIPSIIKMKFGPQRAYPSLQVSGINDKAGKELADILGIAIDKKIIKPDDQLDSFFRKAFRLPNADPSTAREVIAPNPIGALPEQRPSIPNPPQNNNALLTEKVDRIKLAETWKSSFNDQKAATKAAMQVELRKMLDGMKAKIEREWKSSTPATRHTIGTKIEASGVTKYRDALREILAESAMIGLDSARKEIPGGKKFKLSEAIKLAAPKGGYYDALPADVRKRIVDVQSTLIANTQSADLEKVVAFQFTSSANSTEDIAQILRDIEEKAGDMIEGSTATGASIDAAAANAVSSTLNQARLSFFFEPEVLETIESFTFVNEDPVSEICNELDGTTWAADDPAVDRYSPPLHHNCKSRLVPNIKGDDGNPDVVKGTTSISEKAANAITLHECACNFHLVNREGAQ